MLERCLTALQCEFEGPPDYYFGPRQYEEFLLPALKGVGRGFARGLYIAHQACVVRGWEGGTETCKGLDRPQGWEACSGS